MPPIAALDDDAVAPPLTLMHAGLLVPWANTVMEHEVAALSRQRAAWHVSRMVPVGRETRLNRDFVAGLHDSVPACVEQLAALPLSIVVLGCTSASWDEWLDLPDQRRHPRILTAFGALMTVARRCGWRNVSLVTPYTDAVTDAEVRAFHRGGIEVVGAACAGIDDGFDEITPEKVQDMATKAASKRADALVVSCTNLNTLNLLPTLEAGLGVPVLSSNRAIATVGRWTATPGGGAV